MCLNYKSEKGNIYGDRCRFRHVETQEKPSNKSQKGGAKESVAILESTQLGCVSQDSYPRKSVLHEAGKLGWPRQVPNRRQRTREGPEPARMQTPFPGGGTRGEGRARYHVLPWYCLAGVVSTSSETQRREDRAARKGKGLPRGTGTTVLTYACPTASRVSVAVRPGNRQGW